MKHLAAAGMLAVILVLSGCVEPPSGVAVAARDDQAVDYDVRLLGTGDAPRPDRPGGSVDSLAGGEVATIVGWAPGDRGELIVVSERRLTLLSQRRLSRPDAAEALGDPTNPDLGFRLVLRSLDGALSRVCVLARTAAGAPLSVLAGSDPALCPAP